MNAAKCLAILLTALLFLQEAEAAVEVNFFWSEGCPHCAREIRVLKKIEKDIPEAKISYFEITSSEPNRKLFAEASARLGITEPAVPMTIIGKRVWIGYSPDDETEIREAIRACLRGRCEEEEPGKIEVPVFGEFDPSRHSLLALTIILGALDGFNPCAMWTLIFLIGLLIGMKDSFRMWILGGAFIFGSAVVYFLFMAAWLNLLLFLGALPAIRIAIGFVALAGGAHHLKGYFSDRDAVCPVTAPEKRQMVFSRLKSLALEKSFLLALFGIILLAFVVNLVELICSAGIPAVYTQVLAMHGLPAWQYYAYLSLYILVFMADDLVVFLVAMLTLHVSGLTGTYSRVSRLIGGVVLLAVGILMLFRPGWLMFG